MRKLMTNCLLATALCFVGMTSVQAEEGIKVDLNDIDCREMLKMDDEEKQFTLIFFHGFSSGKNSQMTFDELALTKATDGIEDHCIDNPNDKLLTAFEKFR